MVGLCGQNQVMHCGNKRAFTSALRKRHRRRWGGSRRKKGAV